MVKISINIGIVAVLIYAVWIIFSYIDANHDKERKDVEFNHEVLWEIPELITRYIFD